MCSACGDRETTGSGRLLRLRVGAARTSKDTSLLSDSLGALYSLDDGGDGGADRERFLLSIGSFLLRTATVT